MYKCKGEVKMEIVKKKIEEIFPYENNPRKNDEAVKYVANSIKEFGFRVPIVIDKNNVIVAGHTRYKASKELGLKEVPCVVADDLNEEQITAYRLADNKSAEKAKWDFELLDIEMELIENIDMTELGFDSADIDWAGVEDLSEKNYEEPEHQALQCPVCGAIDYKMHFKKVNAKVDKEIEEAEKEAELFEKEAEVADIEAELEEE